MKKYIILLRATLCSVALSVLNPVSAQVVEPHENSYIPSIGRMVVRPLTLPFASQEESLAAVASSQVDTLGSMYIRSLNGEWTMQQLPAGTSLGSIESAEASNPSTTTYIPQKTNYNNSVMVYKRAISVPFAWIGRAVIIRMSRVSGGCYVIVNGKQVGYSSDARVASEFDITQYVNEGRNELKLVVYSTHSTSDLEGYNDVPQAGIDGDVMLISQPRLRIRDFETQTYKDPNTGDGVVLLNVVMNTSLLNTRTMTLMYEVADQSGRVVAKDKRDVTLDMRGEDTVDFYARIPKIKLWSSESANLYKLTIKTFYEGRYQEYISSDLGFRKIEIGEGGLRINDTKLDLRSVDYDPTDKTPEQVEADIRNFKKNNINTLIISRFEPDESLFGICDRLGVYVFTRANISTEKFGVSRILGGSLANDIKWLDAYLERSKDAYLSSHRYASAVGFILGDGGGNGYALYESYLAVKAMSKDRPVICLQAGAEWNSDITAANVNSPGRDRLLVGELAHWAENPIERFAVDYKRDGVITLSNLNTFADMSDFDLNYQILVRNKVSKQGTIPVMLAPGKSAKITLPIKRYPKQYSLNVDIVAKNGGLKVYERQFN